MKSPTQLSEIENRHLPQNDSPTAAVRHAPRGEIGRKPEARFCGAGWPALVQLDSFDTYLRAPWPKSPFEKGLSGSSLCDSSLGCPPKVAMYRGFDYHRGSRTKLTRPWFEAENFSATVVAHFVVCG